MARDGGAEAFDSGEDALTSGCKVQVSSWSASASVIICIIMCDVENGNEDDDGDDDGDIDGDDGKEDYADCR